MNHYGWCDRHFEELLISLGIECPKDEARVDEIPDAYKSIDGVMENQSDLVDIVHTLKQVVNVKG